MLTLGVSPWMRPSEVPAATPAGGAATSVSNMPPMRPLAEPIVSVAAPASAKKSVGNVLGPAAGAFASVTGMKRDIVPTKEAKERAAKTRKETRQRITSAEERLLVEDEELIELSKRYLIIGMFGLPVIHFVLVWYFSQELVDSNSNWYVKRNARMALLFGCIESILFIAWVTIYQLRKDQFEMLSVLRPSLSLANLT